MDENGRETDWEDGEGTNEMPKKGKKGNVAEKGMKMISRV